MDDVLISIITPAYNAGRYLEQTIQTVLAQTYTRWELLIIDDGSVDDTLVIAQNYAAQDERIIAVSQINGGPSVARNLAINQAKGTWLAFLDADDLWEPQKLQRQMAIASAMPDVGLIYTSGWKFTDNNRFELDDYNIIGGHYQAGQMYKLLYVCNDVPMLSVLARRDAVIKAGPMRTGLLCEDWELWMRMALCGTHFYGLNERLFYYRKHSGGRSGDTLRMQLNQLTIMQWNYKPERFSPAETRQAFIPLLNYLVTELIKQNRKPEARSIVADTAAILPGFKGWYSLLLAAANGGSIKLFEVANRLYRKLTPNKKRSR